MDRQNVNATQSAQERDSGACRGLLERLALELDQLVLTEKEVGVREDRYSAVVSKARSNLQAIVEAMQRRAKTAEACLIEWSDEAGRLRRVVDGDPALVDSRQRILPHLDDENLIAFARIAASNPSDVDYAGLVLTEQEARKRSPELAATVREIANRTPVEPVAASMRSSLERVISLAKDSAELDVSQLAQVKARGKIQFAKESAA